MKIMIASDIHGSAYFCEKMIKVFEKEKPNKLLLLGDILYHGPRNDLPKDYNPKKVIPMLNKIKESLLCVRGNCDAEVDQMVLDFPIMADYCVIPFGDNIIYASHGHIYNENNLPPLSKGDFLVNGHTHVPKFKQYDNYTYVNCGSVSIPKEDSRHSYVILEGGKFAFKDLETMNEFY